jgi:hypothetical protein
MNGMLRRYALCLSDTAIALYGPSCQPESIDGDRRMFAVA